MINICYFCIFLFVIYPSFIALMNGILNKNELPLKLNNNTNSLPKKISDENDEIGYSVAAHNIVSLIKLIFDIFSSFFLNFFFDSNFISIHFLLIFIIIKKQI